MPFDLVKAQSNGRFLDLWCHEEASPKSVGAVMRRRRRRKRRRKEVEEETAYRLFLASSRISHDTNLCYATRTSRDQATQTIDFVLHFVLPLFHLFFFFCLFLPTCKLQPNEYFFMVQRGLRLSCFCRAQFYF